MDWQAIDEGIRINVPPDYSFEKNLDYLDREPIECLHVVEGNGVLKLFTYNGLRSVVRVGEAEDGLLLEFVAGDTPSDDMSKEAIVKIVREWLDLDSDLSEFYALAKDDHLLGDAVEKHYGLRIIGVPDLFEALCWSVIGQQINLRFAYMLKESFVTTYGESMKYGGRKFWSFPEPSVVAKLEPDDLMALKMTGRKSEYIIGIAKLMEAGELSIPGLLEEDNFEAIEKALIRIRGVGPWTANYVMMRCLRYRNAFPIADVGLLNAVKAGLDMERKPTHDEMLVISAPWDGWKAYATFYMWRMLY